MTSTPETLRAPPVARALPPATRRCLRRLRRTLLLIERDIAGLFPTAVSLSYDPDLACRFESTPHDHVVADLLVALRVTGVAIADLDHAIIYTHGTVTTRDGEVV